MDREKLGRIVRETWISYCQEIGDTKPSHLTPWEELSEQDKEAVNAVGAEHVVSGGAVMALPRRVEIPFVQSHSLYTVGSLFSGIGGIDLAFERVGFQIVFQVEIDDYCNKVLSKHWPDVARHRDVKEVGTSNLPNVDVLVGGFPCQDISQAGRRAGVKEGTRSGLWYEFSRIISEIRPRYVLLENVPAITIRGGLSVIGSLTRLGYDAEWGTVPAEAVGASHRRNRWWCVAYPVSVGPSRAIRQGIGMAQGSNRETAIGGQDRLETNMGTGLARGHRTDTGIADQSILGRAVDGLSRGMDRSRFPAERWQPQYSWEEPRTSLPTSSWEPRLKALGNSVVPQVIQPIAEAIWQALEAEDNAAIAGVDVQTAFAFAAP